MAAAGNIGVDGNETGTEAKKHTRTKECLNPADYRSWWALTGEPGLPQDRFTRR